MTQQRWTISFAPLDAGEYQVTVKRSGSVHRFKSKLPPDISDLWTAETKSAEGTRSFRSGIETMTPEGQFFGASNMPTLKEIGERIMDAMLDVGNGTEGVKVLGALEDRVADAGGIELQFDLSQTPELSGIPWEAAYLKSKDRFLAIGTTSNVVRKLDAQSELPSPIEKPIRILVAAANPYEDLNTGYELGNIERRIKELVAGGDNDFEVEALQGTTRDQFRRKVIDWEPHIIHYIGHSAFIDGSGYLYFESEGEDKKSDRVSAEVLRNILLNKRPWVVVLNSCESGKTSREHPMGGVAQDLLGRINIPFVVGMQQPVSDDAAIAFSQDFYAALTDGETIACAVTLGRNAIATQADERTQIELITPALYTSGEIDRIAFVDNGAAATAGAAIGAVAGTAAAKPGLIAQATEWVNGVNGLVKGVVALIGSIVGAYLLVTGLRDDPPAPLGKTNTDEAANDSVSTENVVTEQASSATLGEATNGSNEQSDIQLVDADGRIWTTVQLELRQRAIGRPSVPDESELILPPSGAGNTNYSASYSGSYSGNYSATYSLPAVGSEAVAQSLNPPPMPVMNIAPAAGGEFSVIPSWAEQVADSQIPFCAGVRGSVPFARDAAEPDPDFDLSAALWFNQCMLESISFVGHIERAENTPANRGLALLRAETIAAEYEGFNEFLPDGVSYSGRGDTDPVSPLSPEIMPAAEARNRRVDMVFNPACPMAYNIDAKIAFFGNDLTIDTDGMSQLRALGSKIEPGGRSLIRITGGPARIGHGIFELAEERVRAVMAALPNMEGRNAHVVWPRLVDWRCSELLDTDPAPDYITVEIVPIAVSETIIESPETDTPEQGVEPALSPQRVE